MTPVTCITCTNAGNLTKHGFVRCKVSRRVGWTPSPVWPRECAQHRQAKPEVVAQRQEVLHAR